MSRAITAEDFEWQLRGSCRGLVEDEVFFPDSNSVKANRAAKRICNGPDPIGHPELSCPVLAQCREWALTKREAGGVWGGLDRFERGKILGIPVRR